MLGHDLLPRAFRPAGMAKERQTRHRQTSGVLRWIGASTVGFTVAGAVLHFPGSFPAGTGGTTLQPEAGLVGAVMGAITGALAGALLWWSIRPRALWTIVPATALGFAVTHALGDGLPTTVDYLPIGLAAGVVMGIAQLRAFGDPPEAVGYVAGSALGLGAGLALGLGIAGATGLLQQPWTPGVGAAQHAVVTVIAGAIWGWATGRRLFGGIRLSTTRV